MIQEEYHHEMSPSSLERLSTCPASYLAGLAVEEIQSENNYADIGTLRHKIIETEDFTLSNDMEDIECAENGIEFMNAIKKEHSAYEIQKEISLEIRDKDKIITEGTADVVMLAPNRAVLIDWKTMRGDYTEAKHNLQLKAYSIGIMQRFNVSEVHAYLAMPAKNSFTDFVFKDEKALLKEIKQVIKKAKGKNPKFNPTPKACQYCNARNSCNARLNQMDYLAKNTFDFGTISDENLIKLFDSYQVIKPLEKPIKAEIKKRMELKPVEFTSELVDTTIADNFYLKPVTKTRKIKDTKAFYNDLSPFISKDEFLEHTSISVTPLKKIFASNFAEQKKQTKKIGGDIFDSIKETHLPVKEVRMDLKRKINKGE